MKPILTGAVLLLLAGCATTFKPWKLSDVKEGMARSEVVDLLGEPDATATKDGAEYLTYIYREDLAPTADGTLNNDADIERRVEQLTNTFKDYTFEVMLVDEKVVNYKEIPTE